MTFNALGLVPELTRALADRGYDEPTPIQAQVIPHVLTGRDVLAGAQTGTGKTAAFTLPMLQKLSSTAAGKLPRALVLVPTRELAAQVHESVRSYGKYLRLRSQVIFGGVSINPQISALRAGADIIVATPGRLLDHLQQRTVDLSRIEFLVLDEADRMLDMGFIADIRRVLKQLPAVRQNLMFSATYSDDIRKLAQSLLHDSAEVEVARRNAAVESVGQCVYQVAKTQKRSLLTHLILDGQWSQVLIFTRTKHGANRLTKQLVQDGVNAAAIHGNKSQSARTQALAQFKSGQIRALVATEVASRGLDIRELPHVVNYELPNVPEDYVHRIGRTGRAGASGEAISLVAPDEASLLKDIERLLRKPIPIAELPRFAMRAEQPDSRPSEFARAPGRSGPRSASPQRGRSAGPSSSGGSGRGGSNRAGSGRGGARSGETGSRSAEPNHAGRSDSRHRGGGHAHAARASGGAPSSSRSRSGRR